MENGEDIPGTPSEARTPTRRSRHMKEGVLKEDGEIHEVLSTQSSDKGDVKEDNQELAHLNKVETMVLKVNENLVKMTSKLGDMERVMSNTEIVVDKWLGMWQTTRSKENINHPNIR
eukprot:jgi/Bigna1/127283/aug1.4_g1991